jgi:hypothetical protein
VVYWGKGLAFYLFSDYQDLGCFAVADETNNSMFSKLTIRKFAAGHFLFGV